MKLIPLLLRLKHPLLRLNNSPEAAEKVAVEELPKTGGIGRSKTN